MSLSGEAAAAAAADSEDRDVSGVPATPTAAYRGFWLRLLSPRFLLVVQDNLVASFCGELLVESGLGVSPVATRPTVVDDDVNLLLTP